MKKKSKMITLTIPESLVDFLLREMQTGRDCAMHDIAICLNKNPHDNSKYLQDKQRMCRLYRRANEVLALAAGKEVK